MRLRTGRWLSQREQNRENAPFMNRKICRLFAVWALVALVRALFAGEVVAATFIFVADGTDDVIRQYSELGVEVHVIRNPDLRVPSLLVADQVNQRLVTNINGLGPSGPDIVVLDLSGSTLARASTVEIFGQPGGGIVDVAVSGRGTYFVTSTQNTQIAEVDLSLQLIRRFDSGARTGGLRTLGATVSPDKTTLLVADADHQSGAGFIRAYDSVLGTQVDPLASDALAFPFHLGFSPASTQLYITDRGAGSDEDRILVFDDAFNLVVEFSSGAPNHANFGPFAFLPSGDLAVIESTSVGSETPIRLLKPSGEFISEFGDEISRSTAIAVMEVSDEDGDQITDGLDNCPNVFNPHQDDTDDNGIGDACNGFEDLDGDEWADGLDNCPDDFNADQAEADGDALGDVCDPYPNDTFNFQGLFDLEVAQTTITGLQGDLLSCQSDVTQLQADLELTEGLLAEAVADTDADGVRDTADACPGTTAGAEVDLVGCSLPQFCSGVDVSTGPGRATCNNSDWQNDEPRSENPEDCKAKQGSCSAVSSG